jgi:hypothetical protein
MPGVGFEPTILVLEQAKPFHSLDRAATVIGCRTHGSHERFIHSSSLQAQGDEKTGNNT